MYFLVEVGKVCCGGYRGWGKTLEKGTRKVMKTWCVREEKRVMKRLRWWCIVYF